MSFVTAQPAALSAAAGDLHAIGTAVSATTVAAASPTTGVLPAAADQVSMVTAGLFAAHAQIFQKISAEAQAIHEQFVATLATSAESYAATEAANAVITR